MRRDRHVRGTVRAGAGAGGREHIATAADLGARPSYLWFDSDGRPCGQLPSVVELTVPYVFDATGVPDRVAAILAHAARQVGTLAVVRAGAARRLGLAAGNVVPLVGAEAHPSVSHVVALDGWDSERYDALRRTAPDEIVVVRLPADHEVLEPVRAGVAVVQLVADLHGRAGGRFVADLIREAHRRLVAERLRDRVTLLARGAS